MINLCEQYEKESLQPINDRLNQLEKEKSKCKDKLLKNEIENRISFLNYLKSNLEFSMYWMSNAHPMNEYTGIDNLKVVKCYSW